MSFLNAIKEAISAKSVKEEAIVDATSRTKQFIGEFKDVAKTHPTELNDAAQQLYALEVVKDKAQAKAEGVAKTREAKERLAIAAEAIVDQIGVIAEEVLTLEDAIVADKEATKIVEDRANDTLNTLKAMDVRTALKAARAERARKASAKTTA